MKPDRLTSLISHYAESHRNPINEAIHCICVPAIVFAVLGIGLSINLAFVLAVFFLSLVYYARLGVGAAIAMAVMLGLMIVFWLTLMPARHVFLIALVTFVIAWAGQFVGHAIEGAKPSFLEDMQYLMIGPLFIIGVLRARISGSSKILPY